MPDTAPDWAVAEPETPDWAGSTGEMPDWAQPKIARQGIDPNAAGGFNYAGKQTKVAPDRTDLAELGSDAFAEVRDIPSRLKAGLGVTTDTLETVAAAAMNVIPALHRAATGFDYAGNPPKRFVINTDKDTLTTEPEPLPFQPGKPIIDTGLPEGSDAKQLVEGFLTPGMVATFPFAAAKPVQLYFLSQTVPGAIEATAQSMDPKLTRRERVDAAKNALLNAAMSAAIAHHATAGDPRAVALANELGQTAPKFNGETPPRPLVQTFARTEPLPSVSVPDWATTERVQTTGTTADLSPPPTENLNSQPTPPPAEVATAPVVSSAAAPITDNGPKLVPVDVTDKQIAAMQSAGGERPPDVLDDLEGVTSSPVHFPPEQHGTLVADALAATLNAKGRPTAATKRLQAALSDQAGVPVDEVLTGLTGLNPKYADWTPDDLGQAIIGAHAARETRPDTTPEARVLAEQLARDQLFNQANKASRAGVDSLPVEHLFAGDSMKWNGHEMTVTGFATDADTGNVSGVELDGAYGKQTLPVGTMVHVDTGSLKDAVAPEREIIGMGGAVPSEFENTLESGGTEGNKTHSEWIKDLEKRNPGVKLDIHDHPKSNSISVSRIVVPKEQRGQGRGGAIMREVNQRADALGKRVSLSPSSDFGGSKPRLEQWYKSQGFKPNKGTHPDISDSMVREPAKATTSQTAPQPPVAEPYGPGMGNAIPSEFQHNPAQAIGIKVAAIDAQRAARGLEPLSKTAARSFSTETWEQTLAAVADNFEAPADLVKEMKAEQDAGRPRALTDHDVAMLLYREADLSYQRAKLARDIAATEEDAKAYPHRAEALPALNAERARLADELDALENVIGPARSETGRGLAALRNMVADNYTLTAMEFSRRAAKGGAPITPAEHAELVKLRKQIDESNAALEKAREAEAEERSKRSADEAINARIEQVKETPGYDRQVQSLADRIVSALEREAVAARARLKSKFARTSAGVDPTILGDLAIVGASHIARGTLDFTRWSKAMVADFGEDVIPWLNQAWTRSNAAVDTAVDRLAKGKQSIAVKQRIRKDDIPGNRAQIVEGLKNAAKENRPLDEQGDFIRKLMENFIASGLKEREPLVDAIHGVLRDEIGLADVTRRDVREAMSNYGRYKALNPDEIKAKRRDLSHQIAQTLKLEDIQAKRPMPKSGVEHHTPSTEGRLLVQQVNEAKRRFGVVQTDPAAQLKSALDARKTLLKNKIADLQFQIAAGARSVKTKTPPVFDSEVELLKVQRDDLARQLDEIAPKPGITDAQRAKLAEHTLERSIEFLQKQLAAGDLSARATRPKITSPRLDALRAQMAALRAQREELRALDPAYQKTVEERQRKALLSRLATSTAEYADRLARADFAPRPKREHAWTTSPDVMKARAANEAAKLAFRAGNEKARLAQRTNFQKFSDAAVQWSRNAKLLSWHVYPKLVLASLTRVVADPVGRVLAAPLHAVPGLATKAPYEMGLNVKAEAKNLAGIITAGPQMWRKLTRGHSSIDELGGKEIRDREMMSFIGNSHGMFKEPIRQGAFQHSLEIRARAMIEAGLDPKDPINETALISSAVADANRRIFMHDNLISKYFHRQIVGGLKREGDKGMFGARALANTMEFLMPIVRVPTNIGIYSTQLATGLPEAFMRLTLAAKRGQLSNHAEKLAPDDAAAIARAFKLGMAGTILAAYAWTNPDKFGGVWDEERKKNAKLKAGEIATPLGKMPAWLNHTPEGGFLNTVASARRNYDRYVTKHPDAKTEAQLSAAMFCVMSPVQHMPFADTWLRLFSGYKTPAQKAAAIVRDAAVPAAWTGTLNSMDPRSPKTGLDEFKMAVPGLRQTVPARKP